MGLGLGEKIRAGDKIKDLMVEDEGIGAKDIIEMKNRCWLSDLRIGSKKILC